jgi:protein-S-isoprenylcysteine O-methyltransferase Ste14
MAALTTVLFWTAVTAAAAIITTLLVTVVTRFRLWPPADDTQKTVLHWGLVSVFNVCIVSIAVLEWNSWTLSRPSSLIVGMLLSGCGAVLFVASSRAMGTAETTGQTTDELYTDGLYGRSRNPQYVGMMIGLAGFALLVNSLAVAILSLLHICWLVLLPFAEEPWLRDRFGDEYDDYCNQVPRFVSRRTLCQA